MSLDGDLDRVRGATDAGKTRDWTVAIELGASLPGNPVNPNGSGVDRQLEELLTLTRDTEGKSVNLIIHAERPADAKGELCLQSDVQKKSDCVSGALKNKLVRTERYFVHDGKAEKLPEIEFKDGASDIESLLKDAVQLAPSEKLGLIVQSHGWGADGINTNLGPVPLDTTIGSIQSGLKDSGHSQLDMLDYNSCDMGVAVVMDKTRVAKDVVASASEEGGTIHDGQNMHDALGALLTNSKMTGREFGETIVEQARSGANGQGEANSTPTLANFDRSKYEDFKMGLDRFGAALNATISDGNNLWQVQAAIEKSRIPWDGFDQLNAHNRDLKDFAQNILDAVNAGKFSGDAKPLAEATTDFIRSFNSFATDTFGDESAGYNRIGGLTAYLPGSELLYSKRLASLQTPLHVISSELHQSLNGRAFPNQVMPNIERAMHMLNSWRPAPLYGYQVNSLNYAWGNLLRSQYATNAAIPRAAATYLEQLATAYEHSPMGEQMTFDMAPAAIYGQNSELQKPIQHVTPGWDGFVEKLKHSAR